jgi:hypothetical protein
MLYVDHVHNLRTVLDQLIWHHVAMHTGCGPAPVVAFPVLISAGLLDSLTSASIKLINLAHAKTKFG